MEVPIIVRPLPKTIRISFVIDIEETENVNHFSPLTYIGCLNAEEVVLVNLTLKPRTLLLKEFKLLPSFMAAYVVFLYEEGYASVVYPKLAKWPDCFNKVKLISGGAFVYPGHAADAPITFDTPEIGLGARLVTPPAVVRRRDRAWQRGEGASLPALEWEDCWTEQTPLSFNVLIYPQFLRVPDDLGEERPGSRFGFWSAGTSQEAYRLLKRLVNFPVRAAL